MPIVHIVCVYSTRQNKINIRKINTGVIRKIFVSNYVCIVRTYVILPMHAGALWRKKSFVITEQFCAFTMELSLIGICDTY